MLVRLKQVFPSLTDIVVAGHSAGGQTTVRYALSSKVKASDAGVASIKYIVGNPSSYPYLGPQRPTNFPGCTPFLVPNSTVIASCTYYDNWRYGVKKVSGYIANVTAAVAIAQFENRDVVYLLGQNDTCNELLDPTCNSHGLAKTCSNMLQGRWRLERGLCYCAFLDFFYGSSSSGCGPHYYKIIPGVAHSSYGLFSSVIGRNEIFHARRTNSKSSGDDFSDDLSVASLGSVSIIPFIITLIALNL